MQACCLHVCETGASCGSFLLPCLLLPTLGFLPTTVQTSRASVPINDLMACLHTSLSLGWHLSCTRTHPTASKTQVFVCDSMTWRSASRMLQPRVSLQVVSLQISVVVCGVISVIASASFIVCGCDFSKRANGQEKVCAMA